ncbi:MAG TPA: LysR family transcriptional regulator [Polyangia bacterium]|nr:LysR family transcriptional regulator [Polyangia bacterium]
MDIEWDDWRLFLAVATAGSMSGAARALRVGQPTLSRRIGLMEERLDGALFVRRPDGVTLTALGERLLPAAQRMADFASEATRVIAGGERRPEGRVRIAAPPGLAFDFVAPVAGVLRRRAPGLRLELRADVDYVSLSRGEADLALRFRPPSEHDLVGLAAIPMRVAAFAAKSYARRLPKTYGFGDLDWIAWAPPYEQAPPNPQLLAVLGERFAPVFTSNDFLVQISALEAGVGAMILGRRFHRLTRVEHLVELNLDLGPGSNVTCHLVVAKRMIDVPRIRAVADALIGELDPPVTSPGGRPAPARPAPRPR